MPQKIGNRVNFQAWLNNLFRNDIGWFTTSGVPVNGTSGTLAGFAGPGSQLWDLTGKTMYVNTGTKASPTWTVDAAPGGGVVLGNASTSQVTGGYAADTYLAGSSIAVPVPVVKARYYAYFDMVKTAAGTAAFTVTLRFGTAGAVGDAA